eukprot:302513-Prorocentrum_minimum.AAC.2
MAKRVVSVRRQSCASSGHTCVVCPNETPRTRSHCRVPRREPRELGGRVELGGGERGQRDVATAGGTHGHMGPLVRACLHVCTCCIT